MWRAHPPQRRTPWRTSGRATARTRHPLPCHPRRPRSTPRRRRADSPGESFRTSRASLVRASYSCLSYGRGQPTRCPQSQRATRRSCVNVAFAPDVLRRRARTGNRHRYTRARRGTYADPGSNAEPGGASVDATGRARVRFVAGVERGASRDRGGGSRTTTPSDAGFSAAAKTVHRARFASCPGRRPVDIQHFDASLTSELRHRQSAPGLSGSRPPRVAALPRVELRARLHVRRGH